MLKISNVAILNVARRLGIKKDIQNGVKTYWNEKEATAIINNIQYDNPNSKPALIQNKGAVKTSISIKENFLKATQDYIALIESEKKQLQEIVEKEKEKNKILQIQNEDLIQKQKVISKTCEDKYTAKEIWSEIEKLIITRARSLFSCEYRRAHLYYYSQFKKIHPYIENVNKSLFLKNKQYLLELKDIVLK